MANNLVPGLRHTTPNMQAHQAANALPLVATLPAGHAQNQQLLQQFPQLALQLAAQGAAPSPVTVLVTAKAPDRVEIRVQTTGTASSDQVMQAITKHIRSSCGAMVQPAPGGFIVVKTPNEGTQKALEAALKSVNTLSALVQHLGGNTTATFVKLLERTDCAQALQAFTGNPPQVVLQPVDNQVRVVVMPEAQEESLVAAASLRQARTNTP